jgi:hypothetical protein
MSWFLSRDILNNKPLAFESPNSNEGRVP